MTDTTQVEPTQPLQQPWKAWLTQEIEARKSAEQSSEAWEAQEELRRAYEERAREPSKKHVNIRSRSPPGNKAG